MRKIKTSLIQKYIKENNLTKQQFCKKCNISTSVLNKILNEQYNIHISALFKIAKVINIQVFEFFEN